MTAVGPPPQTLDPSEASLMVGICTTGPTPQSHPWLGFAGDRKTEKVVGAVPCGATWAGRQSEEWCG